MVHSLYIMKIWERLREGSRTRSWDICGPSGLLGRGEPWPDRTLS